jgi:hypothetical protein
MWRCLHMVWPISLFLSARSTNTTSNSSVPLLYTLLLPHIRLGRLGNKDNSTIASGVFCFAINSEITTQKRKTNTSLVSMEGVQKVEFCREWQLTCGVSDSPVLRSEMNKVLLFVSLNQPPFCRWTQFPLENSSCLFSKQTKQSPTQTNMGQNLSRGVDEVTPPPDASSSFGITMYTPVSPVAAAAPSWVRDTFFFPPLLFGCYRS